VAKHGNRAASSQCGSADLLEGLGVAIDVGPEAVSRCIDDAGIGFCFGQRYHPAMKHGGPVRRELGIPTVMNVLGPLSNPAGAQAQVIGVYDRSMAPRLVEALRRLGKERAMLVWGHDGLDELTTTTTSSVWELEGDAVREYEVDPSALGLRRAGAAEVRGGDVGCNVDLARRVLAGEKGAMRDIVVLNAAAALRVARLADDLAAGLELAADVLDGGRAAAALDALVASSNAA